MFRLPTTEDVVKEAVKGLTPSQRQALKLVEKDVEERPELYRLLAS